MVKKGGGEEEGWQFPLLSLAIAQSISIDSRVEEAMSISSLLSL